MNKEKKLVRIWTDEDFAKIIKKTAIEKGVSFAKLTKQCADDPSVFKELEHEARSNKKRKGDFNSLF